VSEIDLLPTLMELAGVPTTLDYPLHGRSFAGLLRENPDAATSDAGHPYIFAEISNLGPLPNDGMQERSVFDGRWKLIYRERVETSWRQVNADSREFKTWGNRTYAETIRLKDRYPMPYRILSEMDPQNLAGRVPKLELYDLQSDSDEINNLAADARHVAEKERLLDALRQWVRLTDDTSVDP
jgi:N-sulfoglucosamine sulfohydrolase